MVGWDCFYIKQFFLLFGRPIALLISFRLVSHRWANYCEGEWVTHWRERERGFQIEGQLASSYFGQPRARWIRKEKKKEKDDVVIAKVVVYVSGKVLCPFTLTTPLQTGRTSTSKEKKEKNGVDGHFSRWDSLFRQVQRTKLKQQN